MARVGLITSNSKQLLLKATKCYKYLVAFALYFKF